MDVNFEWKLTSEERQSISSKIERIFSLGNIPAADQFIFKSPTFSDNQSKSGTKWYLEITSGNCIQLKLCLADSEKLAPLRITYKLVFRVGNAEIRQASLEAREIFVPKKSCKTTRGKKFLNVQYYLALNNMYIIICECNIKIEVIENANILGCIQTDYEKLFNDTKYSDFMLVTSAKKFNVHKNILAARSEVFAAMFEHNMKEIKQGFAEMKEFNDEIIQEFLRYIYCGKVENLDKLAKDLLVVAEKYLMFDLKVLCLEEVCKHINIENAVELLVLVDNHNIEHLRSSVIDFIVQNVKDSTMKSNLNTIENVKLSNEILCRTINKYV